jgi:colanic acid biosynthesis glycosyl transferase WcaI
MRILLLTQWYLPEPQEFLSELAVTLQDLGHTVTVLTGFPNWPAGKLYPGYRIRAWQKEMISGVNVIRVPLYPNHSCSALRRAVNFVSFMVSLLVLGIWLSPEVDVIHVIHPPITVGLPAWILSRLKGIPFTLEIQDMWPETLSATGMVKNKYVLDAIGHFAKWVYGRSAAIRVISPGFKKNLVAKGVSSDKVTIISNWVDTDFFKPIPYDGEWAHQLGIDGTFNVMFAGTIGLAQGLHTVLEAAELLQDLPDVRFVLVGDGADLGRLRTMALERENHNVKFLGRHPGSQMPRFYALADALFLHLRSDPLFTITIPHKLFTYLASGRPILAAVDGDAADIVRDIDAGLVCPPEDPEALAEGVRRLHSLSESERSAMGNRGRLAAVEQYDRVYLVTQIEKMLSDAVAGHQHHPLQTKASR